MTDRQMIQAQIDVLCDQLDRNSTHFLTRQRDRDEIRALALHLIQKRDAMSKD
jgi:hypothetical protein